jgi:anti-sigma B factor antagonist
MKITVEQIDGATAVSSLPSFIDASNAMEFKKVLAPVVSSSPCVILDMSAVKFIDSAGCGALITFLKQLKDTGGTLKLFAVQKQVRSVFELVRMHKIIDICNTREEALSSFSRT